MMIVQQVIVVIIAIINSQFQPGDFSAGSTTVTIAVNVLDNKPRKKRKRKLWVNPWLQRRSKRGEFNTLLQEMKLEDQGGYKNYLRMTGENFLELLTIVKGDLEKQSTQMREAIPANMKLAATIRFLSIRASYTDLQYVFRIHQSTFSKFIPEVCEALYKNMKTQYLKVCFYLFSTKNTSLSYTLDFANLKYLVY